MSRVDGPLLVFGPASSTYDFGPSHPLTPRRFGPGIDLLRALGAEPGLAPEPASDEELRAVHERAYVAAVRRFAAEPASAPVFGIAPFGDCPPFAGMHDASAAVAGGSLRAVEAILRGEVEHAFHPGGGLHHALPARASGFCIYNDVALAIARARLAGLRVLYVDLDVHHGDGVQAIHFADPGVLTFSIHESGRTLFPGTGFVDELGEGTAVGTAVNVPLEAGTGEGPWLEAIHGLVPALAAAFGPDLVVSQHGADAHAFDPLAHLRVTTTAMGEAARLVDALAHRRARGRWLATGGGGYDAYRVVPRAWALTWLAGAHREAPIAIPARWRERWADEAARYGQLPVPETFDDPPNAGLSAAGSQAVAEAGSRAAIDLVRRLALPAVVRFALERGWWSPLGDQVGRDRGPGDSATLAAGAPTIVPELGPAILERLAIAPRTIAPADPADVHGLLLGALRSADDVAVSAAVAGSLIVGLAVSVGPPSAAPSARDLIAIGVAPDHRGAGLATRLLEAHLSGVARGRPGPTAWTATVTVAERDPMEPLPVATRRLIAERLLRRAGFRILPAPRDLAAADRWAFAAER